MSWGAWAPTAPLIAAALLLLALGACEDAGPPPANDAECRASRLCRRDGICVFDRRTKKCVAGSDADCAGAEICGKDLKCKKVGDTCGTGE